eukprot:scaffold3788_cov158-Ochromonas_danica.AAC.2
MAGLTVCSIVKEENTTMGLPFRGLLLPTSPSVVRGVSKKSRSSERWGKRSSINQSICSGCWQTPFDAEL